MSFKGIDHVVIAVEDLDKGIEQYEKIFGQKATERGEVAAGGFSNCFFRFEGSAVELVSPTNEDGPVARGIKGRGPGVYLMAMRVDDVDATVAQLRKEGLRLIGDPGEGKPVTGQVFVHPSATSGVLLQIVKGSAH
jgi:methylmalonyl-CoA/ethylmalonyl-CoA epimerase